MIEHYIDYYSCDSCEEEFIHLVEHLIENIKHLEAKVVFLRYTLSKYIPEHIAKLLLSDIFSDLTGCFGDFPAYQKYMGRYYNGADPANSEEHNDHLISISKGNTIVNL